jgi:type IV secretion system protein VirD4
MNARMTIALKFFATFLLLLAIAVAGNYLAGMLCLAFFAQDPRGVQWDTFWYAWQHTQSGSKASSKVVLAGTIGYFVMALLPFLTWVTGRKVNPNVHGQARFASEAECEKQGFFGHTGLVVGRLGNRLLRFPGSEFVMLSAPTRSGKGVSTVIPTLLSFEGSVVVLDIKGENHQVTSQFRASHLHNAVFYFNPFVETSHRWNPLGYVSNDPRARGRDLLALAVIVYPEDPKNPFFSHSSRNMFVALGLLVLETPELPPTLGEMLRQASGKGQSLRAYLTQVRDHRQASPTPLSASCQEGLNRLLQNADETLQNIQASFLAPLSMWASPLVDKATSANDFDLCDLRRRRMSIYLHVPAGEVMQAGFLLNLFFSQLINENVRVLPEHDITLKHPCLLLMDEFTAVGKIGILAKAVGFIAGYNLRLLLIIQDKAQLVATYGKEDAQNISANMGLVISFAPKQLEEAEQLSKMIGDTTVKVLSVQHANVGLLNSGKYSESVTETEQKRAVMLPQELLAMDADKALLIRQGMPVVYANKIRYFKDPFFASRLAKVLHAAANAGASGRAMPLALPLPAANWPAFQDQVLQSDYYLLSKPNTHNPRYPENPMPARDPVGSEMDALAQSFLALYLSQNDLGPNEGPSELIASFPGLTPVLP